MKTKICTKGYSCGLTCINRERGCSKELTGQSIELCSQLASLISDRPIEKKQEEFDDDDGFASLDGLDEALEQSKKKARVPREKLFNKTSKGRYKSSKYEVKITQNHIEFKVDGSLDQKENLDKREAVGLGIAVMKQVRDILKTQPEGSIFTCSAWAMDGAGESRAKLYQALGMGKPGGNDLMGGRIENGKLVPIKYDEIPESHRNWANR